MNRTFKTIALSAALASVLAACGGGDSPDPTTYNSLLTVTAATNATFNGAYSSNNTSLSDVQKITRVGATDACEFTFDNIKKVGDATVNVRGQARYIRDNNNLDQFNLAIGTSSYTIADSSNTVVDRTNNEIRLTGKTMASVDGDTNTFVVTGNIPLKPGRPDGC